jgi:hypothetical protein
MTCINTQPGSDGTFPSRFVGKTLSLEGVVTATNYRNGGYFISENLNGPWRGILILDRDSKVQIGDRVKVSGSVSEFYGMTCLQDISQTRVLSSNNPLPTPLMLTSGQVAGSEEAEAYEGVYVRLLNLMPTQNKSNRNKLLVTDGSGPCVVQKDLFNPKLSSGTSNSQYASITGVVVYSFSEFALGPVSGKDMIVNQPKFIQNRSWGKIKSIYK